jgi:hypothetical protein
MAHYSIPKTSTACHRSGQIPVAHFLKMLKKIKKVFTKIKTGV